MTHWENLPLTMYTLTRFPGLPHPCPFRPATTAHRGVVPLCPPTRDLSLGIQLQQVELLTTPAQMIRCPYHHGKALTCHLGSLTTLVPRRL
jgi:hypothetical protein